MTFEATNSYGLAGRVALVTGGASGDRASGRRSPGRERRARVAVLDRDAGAARAVAGALGGGRVRRRRDQLRGGERGGRGGRGDLRPARRARASRRHRRRLAPHGRRVGRRVAQGVRGQLRRRLQPGRRSSRAWSSAAMRIVNVASIAGKEGNPMAAADRRARRR